MYVPQAFKHDIELRGGMYNLNLLEGEAVPRGRN